MSFNKRYVYRALIRIRSSWNEIISSGGKACSYQANTSFRYQCCDMIPNRLILCFERGLRPLNMKISISTVLLWSDRVLFIRKKCLKALPTCVNIESWNITAQELTFVEQEQHYAHKGSHIFPILLFHVCAFSNPLRPVRSDISMILWASYQTFVRTAHSPSVSSEFPPGSSWRKDRTGKQSDREAPQRPFPKKSGMALYENSIHTKTNEVSLVAAVSRTPVSPFSLERTRVWKASLTGPLSPTLSAPFKTKKGQPMIEPRYTANIL